MLWTVEYLEKVYKYYEELSNGCGAGYETQTRAEYYLETGDFKKAGLFANKAVYKAENKEQMDVAVKEGRIPFELSVKTPNSETIEAMLEAEKLSRDPKNKRYSNFMEAFDE